MKDNRWRKGLVVGLLVVAVTMAIGELAWALNGAWMTKTSMPTARYGLGVGVVNGILYAVGGYNGAYLNTLEAYNPGTDTWSPKASLGTPGYQAGIGAVNGILYAVGGSNSTGNLNTVEAYNPSTNTWVPVASMPTARSYLGVGVVNGILYAVGGDVAITSNVPTSTVEAYNPRTNMWSTRAPMPTARFGLGVGVANGILYAVGGVNSSPVIVNTVEAYDPRSNTWSTKAPMTTPRFTPGVAVVNGILYAAGGYNGTTFLNTVEAYNPSTDTWTPVASMPTARGYLGVGVASGILYAVGGVNSSSVLSTNEAFPSPFFAALFSNVELDLDSNSFDLNSIFALGATRSIDPLTQAVTVQVGGYSVTIPAGFFHRDWEGNFVYEGTINGVALEASITPLRGNRYFFALAGQGATNLPTHNPVTVGLTIGDNGRSANINAEFE